MLQQLHYNAVPAETLGLLRDLQALEILRSSYLVGGTALALYVGHRISEDIDLFIAESFQPSELEAIIAQGHSLTETGRAKNTLSARIDGVKADIITFAYPMLEPVAEVEGLRLASIPDIAAMKISAIINRGAKKDFWDIHHLLNLVSLAEILDFFQKKFRQHEILHALRALTYFDDAENFPDPITLLPVTWSQVKKDISNAVRHFSRQ
ncbi:MAG: nucleotidyl transferase AbiEii/AbiGii toxin family protein [Candidatus Kapabacteria bacterium]|jgi:predicted nucleotidyltransferase component of viral defense system|nr:nucleotidyl transferase AbiEii/AbiGii toxin family protein [Candidatus Kapabacteria bacterium]